MKKYIKFIPIPIIVILVFSYFCFKNSEEVIEETSPSILEPKIEVTEEPIIEMIKVEIKGEVVSPGVYELPLNSRVFELINIAGGLTEKAVLTNINQAKKLADEMVVVVYNQDDLVEEVKTEYVYLECTCPEVKNDACVEDAKEEVSNDKISINNATKEELMTLNGVGEKMATKIIEYRKETPFKTIEEIKNVSGIGDSLYEKIKDFIII